MNDERLFTYDELAKRFKVSKSWLYARVREGRLMPWEGSTYRVTRFTESEVGRFVGTPLLPKDFRDSTASGEVVETTVIGSDGKP